MYIILMIFGAHIIWIPDKKCRFSVNGGGEQKKTIKPCIHFMDLQNPRKGLTLSKRVSQVLRIHTGFGTHQCLKYNYEIRMYTHLQQRRSKAWLCSRKCFYWTLMVSKEIIAVASKSIKEKIVHWLFKIPKQKRSH